MTDNASEKDDPGKGDPLARINFTLNLPDVLFDPTVARQFQAAMLESFNLFAADLQPPPESIEESNSDE